MSLPEMQTALAMIVRYPSAFQGDELTPLLAQFDLTDKEKLSLAALAGNRELGKFGFGLKDMRWSMIVARMPLLQKAVANEVLFELFTDVFDPDSANIPNQELALAFLTFLEENETAREKLKAAPPYVWDFLAFEKVQVQIEQDRWQGLPEISEASPLLTRAIYPRAFSYDIPGYLMALEEAIATGAGAPEPVESPTCALLLGTEMLPGYRLFVLEQDTFDFLNLVLQDEIPSTLPTSYADLVDAGLCKADWMKRANVAV